MQAVFKTNRLRLLTFNHIFRKLKHKIPVNAVIFFLFFSLPHVNYGQNVENYNGSVKGKIIDDQNNSPIEYATVSLITLPDGKTVNGGITDAKGDFNIENVSIGTYRLVVDFLGYKKNIINNILISNSELHIDLGNIKMLADQQLLNEVTVTGQKNIIENKIDKIVYNADRDITSQNGVATDVLKKVPRVSVDIDGNVELQGI